MQYYVINREDGFSTLYNMLNSYNVLIRTSNLIFYSQFLRISVSERLTY